MTKKKNRLIKMEKDVTITLRFGQKIRLLRKQQGISQEELGFKANLHSTHIGMIERGVKNISIETIEKLSNALGITISELFNENYILNNKKETLLTEINGILRSKDEKTILFIRNLIKESLIWLKGK